MSTNPFLKLLMLLVCIHFTYFSADAKKLFTTKYEIEGYEVGTQGSYLVKVSVYTKSSSVSVEEFKYAAVHGVIFKGFSGKGFTTQKPLAKPETESQHSDFFETFFGKNDYLAYADVINPTADRIKTGKEYKMSAIVSVSKDNLRKTLEDAGVIRNLNSGF